MPEGFRAIEKVTERAALFEDNAMSQPANGLLRLDLHVHTAFSYDGFTTPEQLARTCRRRGYYRTRHNGPQHPGGSSYLPTGASAQGHRRGRSQHQVGPRDWTISEGADTRRTLGQRNHSPHSGAGRSCLSSAPFRPSSIDLISPAASWKRLRSEVDMVEVFNSRNLFDKANRQALDYAQANKQASDRGQ